MTNIAPEPDPLPPDPRRMLHIPVSKLLIDGEAQRSLTGEKVARMANEWDWMRAEAATVVPMGNGMFRVVEAQHRVRALQYADPSAKMYCLVLPESERGPAREAKLGRAISTGRTAYTQYAKWVSCVASNEPHEVQATAVLNSYGLRVGVAQSARTIAAVGTVSKLVHGKKNTPAHGASLLDTVLKIVMSTWPDHDPSSSTTRFDGRLLDAIGFIVSRNPELDVRRMVAKLGTKKAMRWVDDVLNSSPGRSLRDLIPSSMAASYNSGLRSGSRLQL